MFNPNFKLEDILLPEAAAYNRAETIKARAKAMDTTEPPFKPAFIFATNIDGKLTAYPKLPRPQPPIYPSAPLHQLSQIVTAGEKKERGTYWRRSLVQPCFLIQAKKYVRFDFLKRPEDASCQLFFTLRFRHRVLDPIPITSATKGEELTPPFHILPYPITEGQDNGISQFLHDNGLLEFQIHNFKGIEGFYLYINFPSDHTKGRGIINELQLTKWHLQIDGFFNGKPIYQSIPLTAIEEINADTIADFH